MIRTLKTDERLLVHSMGKAIRILAIATTEDEANRFMETHANAAVIAEFAPMIFIADKYDR